MLCVLQGTLQDTLQVTSKDMLQSDDWQPNLDMHQHYGMQHGICGGNAVHLDSCKTCWIS